MTSPFPDRLRGFPLATVPCSLAKTGSSSHALRIPYRVPQQTACPQKSGHLPWSSGPLRDNSTRCPPNTGFPHPLCSAHAVSHDLDGLLHPEPCRFISPHSHVQGSLFKGLPSHTAEQDFACPCPHGVFPNSLPPASRKHQEKEPASKALIHARVRHEPRRFRPRHARSLPEFSTSSGISPHPLPTASRWLHPRPFKTHGVSRKMRPGRLLREDLPVQDFWPAQNRRKDRQALPSPFEGLRPNAGANQMSPPGRPPPMELPALRSVPV
jgi:hypothetical protein